MSHRPIIDAEAGQAVTVLIDDGAGARMATAEIHRLARLRAAGGSVGGIRLVNTLTGSAACRRHRAHP